MPNDTSSEPQRIVLLVGLPGSGKSTYLERLGVTALSSDTVRLLLADDATDQTIHGRVFATLRYLVRQRLAICRPITYVDATHLTPRERRPYVKIAQKYGCQIDALFFDVPLEVCLDRNRQRDRSVSEEVMRKMAEKLKPPVFEEGFEKITVVRVKTAG